MIYLPTKVYKQIKTHEYLKSIDIDKLKDNPICPHCEKVAIRDIGYSEKRIARCPHCGYHGIMNVTLKEYAEKKLYN